MLYISWFKWANVQIDFGRELYTAWRLTEGDLPVRDVFRSFGPLSDYWNALMFSLFGVSLKTLLFVNLVIYAIIVGLMLFLLKKAFGFFPAVIASILGVLIFGFSDYTGWGNYNYLTPYSHGATHGMLLLLLLMTWVVCRPPNGKYNGIPEGVIFGLMCLTKIEFVFSGLIILFLSFLRNTATNGLAVGLFFLAKTAVTTLLLLLGTWGIFCIYLTPKEAMEAAWACFLIFQSSTISTPFQLETLGVDNIKGNIIRHFMAAGAAACLFGGLALVLRPLKKYYFLAGSVIIVLAVFISNRMEWAQLGFVLIEILLVAGIYTMYENQTKSLGAQAGHGRNLRPILAIDSPIAWARLVLVVGALAMLARMPLNTRIYHYGFYQAMLAGVVCFAFLFGIAPRLAGKCYASRLVFFLALIGVATMGSWQLIKINNFRYGWKTISLDGSLDSLVVDDYSIYPAGMLMGVAAKYLKPIVNKNDRLMVVPEGVMLNYWLRLKGATSMVSYSPEIYVPQRDVIWSELLKNPPKYVIGVTRMSIREYNIPHYGYNAGSGKDLVDWIGKNYVVMQQYGGEPFKANSYGLIIYIHKDAPDIKKSAD